jgi:hypothetical protein
MMARYIDDAEAWVVGKVEEQVEKMRAWRGEEEEDDGVPPHVPLATF